MGSFQKTAPLRSPAQYWKRVLRWVNRAEDRFKPALHRAIAETKRSGSLVLEMPTEREIPIIAQQDLYVLATSYLEDGSFNSAEAGLALTLFNAAFWISNRQSVRASYAVDAITALHRGSFPFAEYFLAMSSVKSRKAYKNPIRSEFYIDDVVLQLAVGAIRLWEKGKFRFEPSIVSDFVFTDPSRSIDKKIPGHDSLPIFVPSDESCDFLDDMAHHFYSSYRYQDTILIMPVLSELAEMCYRIPHSMPLKLVEIVEQHLQDVMGESRYGEISGRVLNEVMVGSLKGTLTVIDELNRYVYEELPDDVGSGMMLDILNIMIETAFLFYASHLTDNPFYKREILSLSKSVERMVAVIDNLYIVRAPILLINYAEYLCKLIKYEIRKSMISKL